ncbi:MAG: ATP-binding protein [Lachnospiraceae bacterium]|nr:ATP-binding protein [Lachnospiraceae bacterium]
MELKRLYSLTRQTLDEYKMIEKGDKVAVGISGGKDSLTLLYALAGLRQFYPEKFELDAVTVDVGFDMDFSKVEKLCDELEVTYTIIKTEIKDIVFDKREEKNPCSLCAKLRKGALYSKLNEMGVNKIAYAHHKDDVVNTFMMSLFYEGRIQTLEPKTFLEGADITVIRPLIHISEADIVGFTNKMNLPVVKNNCPVDGSTKREYVSELMNQINKDTPSVKNRIFTAIDKGIYKDFK